MRYLTYIFLAGSILLVGCGDSTTDTEQVATPSATQESVALAEAGIVSLDEIISEFSDNGVVAELKYHDETLTISGVIDAISSSASGGRTFVTVARSREWQSSYSLLLCEVELSAVLELKADDPIIVTGFFQSE